MHEAAGASIDRPVTRGEATDLEIEFEARLVDSAALAFRIAYSVLRHREDAEDAAQEALARAYRKLGTLRERERFRAWLVRICWRLARDRRRAAKRRERREQAVVGAAREPTAEDMAAASEFRARLWQAIDQLPEKLRMVLVLAGIEGYDVREVAALLDLPTGTVKSRLFLARRRLAERLR
ncbi:MAG TPA: sigma-70 family RNA polymerase sigma factor [Vicinamibacteria bacterium]|jgi:RNA polymerase sigma-70 factor, ECF subfamily|nr:sigma-70 family RNA polymerase sigma factor [Vicinamibacteria bacterium]